MAAIRQFSDTSAAVRAGMGFLGHVRLNFQGHEDVPQAIERRAREFTAEAIGVPTTDKRIPQGFVQLQLATETWSLLFFAP